MMADPHYYRYDGKFVPEFCPINWDAEDDFNKCMQAAGWFSDSAYGSEYHHNIETYRRNAEQDDGSRMVMLSDYGGEIWMCFVPREWWPHFYRVEMLPFIAAPEAERIREEIKKIAGAVISGVRYGLGKEDAHPDMGYSIEDQERERQRTERARRRHERERLERQAQQGPTIA